MSAAAFKQHHVLSLCVLSIGGRITLCRCKVLQVFLCCVTLSASCTQTVACLDLFVCARMYEYVCLCDLSSLPVTDTQRSVLTAHLQSWVPPSSEIKSLFSQAAYWVKASKHRCSASRTDNMGFKYHPRLPAYTIKGLCVGPDSIYQGRSTWQSILHRVTADFLFVD